MGLGWAFRDRRKKYEYRLSLVMIRPHQLIHYDIRKTPKRRPGRNLALEQIWGLDPPPPLKPEPPRQDVVAPGLPFEEE